MNEEEKRLLMLALQYQNDQWVREAVFQDARKPAKYIELMQAMQKQEYVEQMQEVQEPKYHYLTGSYYADTKPIRESSDTPKFCPECGAWIYDLYDDSHQIGFKRGQAYERHKIRLRIIMWLILIGLMVLFGLTSAWIGPMPWGIP